MGRYTDLALALVLSSCFRTSVGQKPAFQWKFNTNVSAFDSPPSIAPIFTYDRAFHVYDCRSSPYSTPVVVLDDVDGMPELPRPRPEPIGHEHERSRNPSVLHDRVQAEWYSDDEFYRLQSNKFDMDREPG